MELEVDAWLEQLGQYEEVLMEESNVQPVRCPVTVCGDTHGQFHDLLELFPYGRELSGHKLPLHGGLCRSGLPLCRDSLSAAVPSSCAIGTVSRFSAGTTSRGRLRRFTASTTSVSAKYGNANVRRYFTDLFDFLPPTALVDNQIFCLHGGLSPSIDTLDHVRSIDRVQEVPHEGPMCDLLWSDPDDRCGWGISPRGAGIRGDKTSRKRSITITGLPLLHGHTSWS
ncbi:Serine/threonine-protein phosphatase [Mycena venus]|uniref:protein-serine/threonine phosphatase n=1 Tax=Mycena venus TaxID=2733690 RepID=A0A8H7CD27_9AGAR|nr:Serine/threonine-protein phosphatase [Mycena venus]